MSGFVEIGKHSGKAGTFLLILVVSPVSVAQEQSVNRTDFCKDAATDAQPCHDCYDNGSDPNVEDIKHVVRQATPSANLSEEAQYVVDGMSEVANCPNRLWPGLILGERPYIIFDKKSKTPVVVSHRYCSAPSYRPPNSTEFQTDHLKTEVFSFTEIEGNNAVIISVSSINDMFANIDPEKLKEMGPERVKKMKLRIKQGNLETLVHEAFHSCDQDHGGWNMKDVKVGGGRFSRDSEDCTPRKYRAHVRHYLEKALKEKVNSDEYNKALRQASYWNKKYINEFPEEFKMANVTDIMEGSAEFVGNMAVVLKEKGCQATDKELQEAFLGNYFDTKPPVEILFTPDAESYVIGSLSAALLAKSSFPNWQKKVENKQSPVQLLLTDVPPLQTSEVPAIRDGCRIFENVKKAREFDVQNINKAVESEDYIALSITHTPETRKTAMGMLGHANKGTLNAGTVLDTGSSEVHFTNVHLLEPKNESRSNQCGDNQAVILVPKSSLSFKEGSSVSQVKFSGKKDMMHPVSGRISKADFSLNGQATITNRIEQEGADIWCAQ